MDRLYLCSDCNKKDIPRAARKCPQCKGVANLMHWWCAHCAYRLNSCAGCKKPLFEKKDRPSVARGLASAGDVVCYVCPKPLPADAVCKLCQSCRADYGLCSQKCADSMKQCPICGNSFGGGQ